MVKKNFGRSGQGVKGEAMAYEAASYAEDKKAEDIVIMDMRGISPVTDYYVLCTATSMPHLRAIRNEIRERFLEEQELRPVAADENFESLWIILHYGDVMLHVFHKNRREFYALEDLWGDAPRLKWPREIPLEPKNVTKKSPTKKAARKSAADKGAVKVAKKAVAKKGVAKKPAKKTAKKTA